MRSLYSNSRKACVFLSHHLHRGPSTASAKFTTGNRSEGWLWGCCGRFLGSTNVFRCIESMEQSDKLTDVHAQRTLRSQQLKSWDGAKTARCLRRGV